MWDKYVSLWKAVGKNTGEVFATENKEQDKLNILGGRLLMICAIVSIFFIIGLILFPLDANHANKIVNQNVKPSWLEIILIAIFVAPIGLVASIIFACAKIK